MFPSEAALTGDEGSKPLGEFIDQICKEIRTKEIRKEEVKEEKA